MNNSTREIKFRVWDESEERMKQVESLGCYNLNDNFTDSRGPLLQYTGLKDKNGVEIYEGDVVQNRRGSKDVIEWSDLELMWVAKDFDPKFGTMALSDLNTVATIEVAGHIYDGKSYE